MTVTSPSTPTLANPYVGPRSFRPGERLYGRDRELRDLTGLIIAERIVLMHSPSGAGKTSLIQAALVPALERRDFRVEPVIRLNTAPPPDAPPGVNRYVLSALLSLAQQHADHETPLEQLATQSLSEYLDARDAAEGADRPDRLLIFDQFEEVLTVDPLNHVAKVDFFEQLGAALRDRDTHRWALFSMREDYLASLTPYLPYVPTRFKTTFRLDLLDPIGARQAIQGPVQAAEHSFSDAAAEVLVNDLRRVQVQRADDTIVNELGQGIEPVQLQVVCYRLWQRLAAQRPPADATTPINVQPADIAGVATVDRSLEEYYAEGVARAVAESGVPERDIREWFEGKLITPLRIRGQVLRGVEQSDGLANSAIQPLIASYLVRAEQRRGLTWYELAHDRLIGPVQADNRRWFEQNLSALQRQAERWNQANRAPSLLFRDADLTEAEAWVKAYTGELRPVEQEFLTSCAELRAELERERRTAQRIRRLALFSSIAAVVAVIGLIGALIAYQRATAAEAEARQQEQLALAAREEALAQERIAQEQRNLAVARSFAAYALTQADANPERALILARAATQTGTDTASLPPETLEVLQQMQAASRVRRTVAYPDERFTVAYSPDGTLLASAGLNGTIDLIDTQTGATRTFTTLSAATARLSFNRDGTRLAAALGAEGVQIWNVADGAVVQTLPLDGFAFGVTFSPTDDLVAVTNLGFDADFTGGVSLVNLADGETELFVPHGPGGSAADFSADGRSLVSAGFDSVVRVTDLTSGALITETVLLDTPAAVAISPDRTSVVIAEANAPEAVIWNLEDGAIIRAEGHVAPLNHVAFSPDGRMFATAANDRTVQLREVASGETMATLSGFDGVVWQVAFARDGARLAAAGGDGSVSEWDITRIFPSEQTYAVADPSGSLLAVGDADGTVRLLDPASGVLRATLSEHTQRIRAIAFDSTGRRMAAAGEDGRVTLWDVPQARLVQTIRGDSFAYNVHFSPDDTRLYTTIGGAVVVLDAANLAELARYELSQSSLVGMALSPDGTQLALSEQGARLIIIDPATGAERNAIEGELLNGPLSFSPDGARLAARTDLGDIALFDAATLEPTLLGFSQVDGFAFAADGNRLAIARGDNRIEVWDLAAGRTLIQAAEPAPPRWALFHPDQESVISAGSDGLLRSYPIAVDALFARADAQITRPATPAECAQFGLPATSGCAAP
jgi:WD40 repeat protein